MSKKVKTIAFILVLVLGFLCFSWKPCDAADYFFYWFQKQDVKKQEWFNNLTPQQQAYVVNSINAAYDFIYNYLWNPRNFQIYYVVNNYTLSWDFDEGRAYF